jgi:hypothetical protein
MEQFTLVPSAPISHQVELYTARFFVQGLISGPFKRTSDLLNRAENDFLRIDCATIAPVGQSADPRPLSTPLMLVRAQVHFVADAPVPPEGEGTAGAQQAAAFPREYFVQKIAHPCYAFTETFVIFGHCHLLEGANIEQYLKGHDTFVPLTRATIYLVTRSDSPWQRDLVLINKERLEVMYLTDE